MTRFKRVCSYASIAVLGLVLASTSTMAAKETKSTKSTKQESPCKGLTKTKCGSKKDKNKESMCVWVKSYKTKEGKKVDAYCRSKPSDSGKDKKKKKSSKKKSGKKKNKK